MKISLAVFLCLFFSFNISGQTSEDSENTNVNVESIALMRDDGRGNPGDETEFFKTTDIPVHFQIQINSFAPVTFKMTLAAADVKSLKAGTKILTVSYKTNGEQNIVNFKGSPKTVWLAGKYRVEIFIDGKAAGNKEFEISAASPAQNNKKMNLTPPKPNTKTNPKRKN